MLISRYRSNLDVVPEVVELDWPSLVALLTTHADTGCHPCPGKKCTAKSGPAWSPCEVRGSRANANVVAFYAAVFDIDHTTLPALLELEKRVEDAKLATILHSTHSHTPEDCSVRVIFPVSRPVLPAEWQRFRESVIERLKLPADPATKDLSRLYYLPSWSGNPNAPPVAGHIEGAPIDVDAMLASAPKKPTSSTTTASEDSDSFTVDLGDLARLLSDSARNGDPEKRALVKKILQGEPLADEGSRDATLNRACSIVVWSLPNGTPEEAILEILRRSIRAMPGEEGPDYWEHEAADMVARAAARRAEESERQRQWSQRLLQAFSKESAAADVVQNDDESEGSEPYTEEQLAHWAGEQQTDDLSRRWIIQKGTAYYVLVNGRYRSPLTEKELPVSLPRDLARAPVQLFAEGKNQELRNVEPKLILAKHATVAREIQASLLLQKSFYDEATQTFHEAVRPLRNVTVREHPEVHEWLCRLGGVEREKLLDWVATITFLERQSCAIYIQSPPGAGKTLLANGLARLWTEGPPPTLEDILIYNFNDMIATCPLLFADESLPKRPNITSDLRKLIGSPGFSLKRKYLPTCSLQGSVRLIIAGNNAHLLNTSEDLSADDLTAVSSRFLYIQSDSRAAEYLRDFGDLNTWILEDRIAEHALYLRETRSVLPGRRFLVEGTQQDFHEQMAVSSGLANNLLEWIARYLDDPQSSQSPRAHLVMVGEGRLFINSEVFVNEQSWQRYVPSARVQNTTRVGKALASLSDFKASLRVKERQHTFHSIPPRKLFTWIRSTGAVDPEGVSKRIFGKNPKVIAAMAELDLQKASEQLNA